MNDIVNMAAFAPSRRDFLRSGAAGLVVGFTLGAGTKEALAGAGATINAYVQIAADETVTIYVGATEMGQGVMTGMAHLFAEELKLAPANWSKVRVEHGVVLPTTVAGSRDTAPYSKPSAYKTQSTGGSTSMRSWFPYMRQAGAVACDALVQAYADLLNNGSRSGCVAANGAVSGAAAGALTYGQIVAKAASQSYAFKLNWSTKSVTAPTDYQFIGKDKSSPSGPVPFPRTDIADKITGKAVYGVDVNSNVDPALTGMKHAVVMHSPIYGGTVKDFSTPSGAKVFKLWNHSLRDCPASGLNDPEPDLHL